jgi:uncharacterized protein (TIGR02996 family)
MTHAGAFLADIVAHPDDDAPRLVFADWLDEQADRDRAEFIRLQCELARLEEDGPRRPALAERETALLAWHGESWLAAVRADKPLGVNGQPIRAELAFRRGFVEASAELTVPDFLNRGEELFRHIPLRRVRLWRFPPSPHDILLTRELARSSLLGRLPELDLSGSFCLDEDLIELAASPHLGALTRLDLSDQGRAGSAPRPSAVGVRALADSPHLANLRVLDLSRLRLGPAALAALVWGSGLPRLEELIWPDNRCRDGGLRALAESPLLHRLITLRLGRNNLTAEGAAALADWPGPLPLRVLDLGNPPNLPRRNAIGDAGLAALLRGPALSNLRSLLVPGNDVGAGGAWSLAAALHLAQLRDLDLAENHLGDRALEALLALPFPRLRRLDLTGNPLSGDGWRRLRQRWGDGLVGGPP